MHKKLLISACILVIFIWLINTLANKFYWYSAMIWFDIPMHILGGIFLSLISGAIFFKKLKSFSTKEKMVFILLFVLMVGIGWEIFEYVTQAIIKGVQLANFPDSIKDLLMDVVGGVIGFLFVLATIRRYNNTHAE